MPKKTATATVTDIHPTDDDAEPTEVLDAEIVGETGTRVYTGIETTPLDNTDDVVSAVIYGPQGTGKTTMACKLLLAYSVGDLLVINAEGGLKKGALRDHNIPTERIRVWPKPGERPNFSDLEFLLFQLSDALQPGKITVNNKEWCGVLIDSGTETLKLFLDDVMAEGLEGQRALEEKARKAGTKLPPRRGGAKVRFQTDRDDYGVISQQFRTLLRRLKYLGIPIIITALERNDPTSTGKSMYGPAVNPAIMADLLGYADLVLHTEILDGDDGKPIFIARTGPSSITYGKDRYHRLPYVLVNPGMDRIVEYLDGDILEEDDPEQLAIGRSEDGGPVSPPEPVDPKPSGKRGTGKPKMVPTAAPKAETSKARAQRIANPVTTTGDSDDPPF